LIFGVADKRGDIEGFIQLICQDPKPEFLTFLDRFMKLEDSRRAFGISVRIPLHGALEKMRCQIDPAFREAVQRNREEVRNAFEAAAQSNASRLASTLHLSGGNLPLRNRAAAAAAAAPRQEEGPERKQ
jgi:hypothetical protein